MYPDQIMEMKDIAAQFHVGRGTVANWRSNSRYGKIYADNPFPEPDGYIGRSPWWSTERLAEIRTWFFGRVGRGTYQRH